MRILVLTNHFENFGGSEIVALETAKWFLDNGDEVILGANRVGAPIQAAVPRGVTVTERPQILPLEDLDLVWCQHDLLAQWPLAAFEQAARLRRVPHVACVSLSPYEPYESVDVPLAQALTADIYVNSLETGLAQLADTQQDFDQSRVRVFHNAAPRAFWSAGVPRNRPLPARLHSLLLVSNHPPSEVLAALRWVEMAGITIRCVGHGRDVRLLCPDDLRAADAVVTIGKTVPYAIASGTPVYMYDRFGGDGWLARRNFAVSLQHNFSGRPARRRLTDVEIAGELRAGFAEAAREIRLVCSPAVRRRLSLDHQLSVLRRRAEEDGAAARAACLQDHLQRPDLRARFLAALKRSQARQRASQMPLWRRALRFPAAKATAVNTTGPNAQRPTKF